MSALDFISGNTQPSQSANSNTTTTALPSWYQDYTSQILNKAAQWANEPYQAYQGPRIAQQSQQTQDAYSAANGLPQTAAGTTQAAQNLIQQGASAPSPLSAASPNLQQGAGLLAGSVAPGQGGLSAAQPYLNSAANPTYNTVGKYLSPYTSNVVDNIATLGNRQLTEKTLPALHDQFTAAGNLGGNTNEATYAERAARDQGLNTQMAQDSALESGYNTALGAAQQGANTQAGLAGTAGNLGTASQSAQQSAGTGIANIGGALGNLQNTGIQNQFQAGQDTSNVGTQGTNNSIQSIGALNQLGLQNQGYNQSNLTLANQDFQNQRNYPLTQANAMQGALSGIQPGSSTTSNSTYTGTGAGASPLSQILTGLGTYGSQTNPPG